MRSVLASVALVAALAAGPVPASSLCDVSGEWRQNADNIGPSVWKLTPIGGGRYSAQESGLGNARGTAVVTGSTLRIDWQTGNVTGRYEWSLDPACRIGNGQLVFTSGRTGTHNSTVALVASARPDDHETITVCERWEVILRDTATGDRWIGVWQKGQHFSYKATWQGTEGPSQGKRIDDRFVYPITGGSMAFASDVPGGRYVYRTSSRSADLRPGQIEGSWYWEPGSGLATQGGQWRARCADYPQR